MKKYTRTTSALDIPDKSDDYSPGEDAFPLFSTQIAAKPSNVQMTKPFKRLFVHLLSNVVASAHFRDGVKQS